MKYQELLTVPYASHIPEEYDLLSMLCPKCQEYDTTWGYFEHEVDEEGLAILHMETMCVECGYKKSTV